VTANGPFQTAASLVRFPTVSLYEAEAIAVEHFDGEHANLGFVPPGG
jgi:hypothetical protein